MIRLLKMLFSSGMVYLLLSIGCMPYKEEKITEVNFDLSDPVLQRVLDLQDRQQTDSLFEYFRHRDPTYRYAAAVAFGSVQDSLALDSLYPLLSDDIPIVREAAAYAIGQIGSAKAESQLIAAFNPYDSTGEDARFNRFVLEAVGKSASPRHLQTLSTINNYRRKDTLLLEGQTWGIYRYAMRGMVRPEGTSRMVDLLIKPGYPEQVRFVAANYLYRAPNLALDSFAIPLVRIFREESNPRLRMALAIALGKTNHELALQALTDALVTETDYRVKTNMLRALANFDYQKVQADVFAALRDRNEHVSRIAAQFLLDHGRSTDAVQYWRLARDTSLPWQTSTILYQAANRHIPPYFETTVGSINADLRRQWLSSKSSYQKAAILRALGEYGWNYKYVKEQGFQSNIPVVRSTAVEALVNLVSRPDFNTFFGLSARRVKKELAVAFQEAIIGGDAGMAAVAAKALANPQLEFNNLVDSLSALKLALDKLELPRELETHIELKKAIDHLNGHQPGPATKPAYSHPIDWRIVSTINDRTQAIIETSKGKIRLEFFLNEAPATVTNFVMLARGGFFDNKFIHRVVPNFVIQDGCPRGDGYGSLDYTIRSELPPLYYHREGMVGMASAGNHTECSQWFITHSPTPHLDGKYTIFAHVADGMDVVHKLQVGDQIKRIQITG